MAKAKARFTAKEFEEFKLEFKYWQEKLGLGCYKVYFKHELIGGSFADICIDQTNMVATVRVNNKLPEKDIPFGNPERHAKHEALHLLAGRLEMNGRARYIASDEIYEATEELVHRLEVLTNEDD